MSEKLKEENEQLKKEVATLKRELQYAQEVIDFVDRKGYGRDGYEWFNLCWEYRDIGAANIWIEDHEDENFSCKDEECYVCIKLAEE